MKLPVKNNFEKKRETARIFSPEGGYNRKRGEEMAAELVKKGLGEGSSSRKSYFKRSHVRRGGRTFRRGEVIPPTMGSQSQIRDSFLASKKRERGKTLSRKRGCYWDSQKKSRGARGV